MKRRKIIFLTLLSIFIIPLFSKKVFAENNTYYENKNGVIVSEKEYKFIADYYGDSYFENMTYDDYEWLKDLNINENEIEIKTIYDMNSLARGTTHVTASKKLTIVKSCNSDCSIIVKCQWLKNPVVRSYDVIGVRLSGVEVTGSISTKVTSSNGTEYFSNLQMFSSGFGVSVKLPTDTGISVEQKYAVSKGGTIYASYQHAQSNISLTNSKLYTISSSGYGGVFNFYGSASGVYDQMGGVNIST